MTHDGEASARDGVHIEVASDRIAISIGDVSVLDGVLGFIVE